MAYGLTKSWDKELTDQATAVDDTLFDLTTAYTIEGWVNWETLPSAGSNAGIFGKWTTSGNQRSYVFRLNNTGGTYTLQMVADADGAAGGASVASSSSISPSTDTWYHVAVSVSSGNGTFYVGGVSSGTFTGLATPFVGTSVVSLGSERSDGTDGSDAKFSLVRIWKTNRSGTDIANNICNVLGSTTNLSAEWTLNDVYTDNSGNGFTLTPAGAPTFVSNVPSTCASGPVNVKTVDGLAIASVKTISGLNISSIKSINGLQ